METNPQNKHQLHLYGRTIDIGPGTVPISLGSVSATSIQDVIEKARELSKLGVFDIDQPEQNIINGAR